MPRVTGARGSVRNQTRQEEVVSVFRNNKSGEIRMIKRTLLAAVMATSALFTMAGAAQAEEGDWMVRGRVLGVLPDESGDLKVAGTSLPGDVEIGDQYVPELDITYFFTENVAVELILAVTPHDVKATGVTTGPLTNATIDLGDVWLLPPTLTAQYHFNTDGQVKPYVGAGINATFFFDEDEGPVADGIDYDPSVGFALQAGVDIDLDGAPGGWAFNADVKKIWIKPDVTVDFTTALGAKVDAEVDINPLVVGVGLGYRF